MRLISRTLDRDLLREAVPLAAGIAVTGASFGAVAAAAGIGTWNTILMSLLVFAGGSQFLVAGVVAAGGGAIAAVAGGLLLNARMLPFGLTLGTVPGNRWYTRLLGAHLITDETTAFSLARENPRRQRLGFWISGVAVFTSWNIGTVIGLSAAGAIGDTNVIGLDAVFPAALLAFVLPNLTGKPTWRAAITGAVIAVATTPFLPGGVPVLLALAGMLAAGGDTNATEPDSEKAPL